MERRRSDSIDRGPSEDRLFKACVCFVETDQSNAKWLQKRLDSYFLDKLSIDAGEAPRYDRAEPIGRMVRLELRESDALGLSERQRSVLDSSDVLIVACSPDAAKCVGLDRAIRYFQADGEKRKLLAVISDGVPNAGSENQKLECFPPSLRFQVNADESLSHRPREVLAVDLRGQPRSRALAKVVSGIMDVPFDAIWNRERRSELGRAWWLLPPILLGVALILGAGFYISVRPAIRDYIADQSQILLRKSHSALSSGDVHRAARFAVLATYLVRIHLVGSSAEVAEGELRKALVVDAQSRMSAHRESVESALLSIKAANGQSLIQLACKTTLAHGNGRLSDEETDILSYEKSGPYRDICALPRWLLSD